MSLKSKGVRLARAVWRRLPRGLRNHIPGSRRFIGRVAASEPVLSIVIPVYNVREYVAECLDSAINQTLTNIEIIVVDDGSTDGSADVVEAYATADRRVRTFRQQNSGQGIARNLGVSHARGEFLTFLDADDIVPAGAYKYMVDSLRKSGSDFSVGSVERIENDRRTTAPWNPGIHAKDRVGITIDDYPDALQDVIACNRMLRRSFWVDKVGGFRGGTAYEDHVPMVLAFVRAERFDVLKRVTYWWRIREDRTSTGQRKHELQNLRDRVEVKAEAQEVLEKEASEGVFSAWLGRVLDIDLPPFIRHAERADQEYRQVLEAAFARHIDLATPQAWHRVGVYQKLRGWHIAHGRWDVVDAIQRYRRQIGSPPPTAVWGGCIYADISIRDELDPRMPDELLEMGANETAIDARLSRVRWVDDSMVEICGWAYIGAVDLHAGPPLLELSVRDVGTGREIHLPAEPTVDAEATVFAAHPSANYDASAFRTTLDVRELGSQDGPAAGRWALHAKVTARGLVREGGFHRAAPGSSATGHGALSSMVDSLRVTPLWDRLWGFSLDVTKPSFVATGLDLIAHERAVSGRFVAPEGVRPRAVRASLGPGREQVTAKVRKDQDGHWTFTVHIPEQTGPAQQAGGLWTVQVIDSRGTAAPLVWPTTIEQADIGSRSIGNVAWRRTHQAHATVVSDTPLLEAESVEVGDDSIEVTVRVEGLSAKELATACLANPRNEIPVLEVHSGSSTVLSFPTRASSFGGPMLPITHGHYSLDVALADGRRLKAGGTENYLARVRHYATTETIQTRWTYAKEGEARVSILPPLRSDEKGAWAQRRLQEQYQQSAPEPENSVLFQCYRGEFATDSQRALHDALRVRRPDLTLYWGVADFATEVPNGGEPLLIGSRRWYEKLGRSRYLCNNIDFDGFFSKKPHQRYLQTFHGHPFKSMGKTFWEGKGYSAERISHEFERRNREWDAILVPSQMCADIYRTEYDYRGDVLVTGYPRSDVLVETRSAPSRAEILERLGIDPGKTVVLYAPTYRDALTTRTYAAKRFDALDLDMVTTRLGDDYVLLVRGHNNNQRDLDRVHGRARVLDVTDYPEINDLVIASDVALLDYSSLRFEWALTRKPMAFFVPDLEEYFEGRPPLFPYESTAPGPLLRTTAEVAATLLDLDALARGYSEEIERFNAAYNQMQDGHASERVVEAFFTD